MLNNQYALIIFTRNPELGKCKTRLANAIGDVAALEVYKYLLAHTAKICNKVDADKYVFYSEKIRHNDLWDEGIFRKKLQRGADLGERMENAFAELFKLGYKKVGIVGSDLLELNHAIIQKSFEELDSNDYVIGPAKDGGYYLLAMKKLQSSVFKDKDWGTSSVLGDTLKDLTTYKVYSLEILNDIDTFADLKDSPYFRANKDLQNLVSTNHD